MFCYILTHTHIYIHTYIDLQGWGVNFAMVRYFYTFLKRVPLSFKSINLDFFY